MLGFVVAGEEVGDVLGDAPVLDIQDLALGIVAAVLVDGDGLLFHQDDLRLHIGDTSFGITIDDGTAVVEEHDVGLVLADGHEAIGVGGGLHEIIGLA